MSKTEIESVYVIVSKIDNSIPVYEVKLSQDEYDKVRKALKHGK